MTSDKKTAVLVVGASGMMGVKIVRELVATGRATVRATARATSKPEQVAALRDAGAEVVNADLADEASLLAACRGIEVVVCAVQGLRDVIVDGQTRLLRAAEQAGVARLIPSDYSIDLFALSEGENRNLDLRREFDAVLDASKVRGLSVLCGAFMELLLRGFAAPDPKTKTMKIWGDPKQIYDFTTTGDVAKYTAAAALLEDAPRVLRVAGASVSPVDLQAIFSELDGAPVSLESAGTLDELQAKIAELRKADPAPNNSFPVWQQLQYGHNMASGRGQLKPLDNARFPDITPQSVRDFLRAARASGGHS